jgi:hypothetical protein
MAILHIPIKGHLTPLLDFQLSKIKLSILFLTILLTISNNSNFQMRILILICVFTFQRFSNNLKMI